MIRCVLEGGRFHLAAVALEEPRLWFSLLSRERDEFRVETRNLSSGL